ncbi:alpha/beta-hydrolase [Rhizodiscina lignyota]|uniref:Alpha/beta-hydrolase n=1 Tax=Rhizodiscina lignyota TaxID=1504668 RepID=A0A9P4IHE4_9PEZI|nr:alpha/beta-hydrolase [Rhizodiscina lignyota]
MAIQKLLLALACVIQPIISHAIPSQEKRYGPADAISTVELPYIREYFYSGGKYADDGSGEGTHIFKEQMYVEQLTPRTGTIKKYPVVLIHGAAQSGTNWLNKPDGGRGWASAFLEQGYTVYIVDQTLRGRSPWQPDNGTMITISAEQAEKQFTAVQDYNLWPQAKFHTQWPGSGRIGDPIFDTFYATQMQYLNQTPYQQSTIQNAGAALLDRIGKPVILFGHSQAGPYPLLIADKRPHLVRAIVGLEPSGPPFKDAIFDTNPARVWGVSDIPFTYDPPITDPSQLVKVEHPAPSSDFVPCILQAESPPPRKLINLVDIPIIVLTTQASYHSTYDYCTVEYWKQAGIKDVTHLELAKVGIKGNAHMVFMEKNSDVVQAEIERRISKFE